MVSVTPDGPVFYYQNGLQYEDYRVAPVERVQLRQTTEDIGTLWPDLPGQKNTYIIENNPMLAAENSQTLLPVAQTLYEILKTVTYTPCSVTIPATQAISTGDILTITDIRGTVLSAYVMEKTSD